MELIHLLNALWRYKWQILAASLLPALLVAVLKYTGPRNWSIDLLFQIPLEAVSYKKLNDRFYSSENRERLIAGLEKHHASELAQLIRQAEGKNDLALIIGLGILPDYIDFENKEQLKISLERSWAENIEKLQKLHSELIKVHLQGPGEQEMASLNEVVCYNFAEELPLYLVLDQLVSMRLDLNDRLGRIEGNRVELDLGLTSALKTRANLAEIKEGSQSNAELNLKFEDPNKTLNYLPLSVQILSLDSQIARRKAEVEAAEQEFAYRAELQGQVDALIELLRTKMPESYGLSAYLTELHQRENASSGPETRNFLQTHIRYVENLGLGYRAVTHKEKPSPLPRGTLSAALLVAFTMFLVSIVVVSLVAYLRRMQIRNPNLLDD